MFDNFEFETFVDVHSNVFQEYISSIVAKLVEEDAGYRAINTEIDRLYAQYPKVFSVFDSEEADTLTAQECTALIKVLEMRNRLADLEMQAVYFRGCYDSVGYLKKAGLL